MISVNRLQEQLPNSILTKAAIILGLLILEAMLGLGKIPMSPTRLAMATLGGVVMLIALWRMEFALVGLAALSASINISIGTGTQSQINAPMLLLGLLLPLWLVRMLVKKEFRLAPSPANLPLLGFLLVASISLISANTIWPPEVRVNPWRVQFGALGLMVLCGGAFLLVANNVHEPVWLKYMMGAVTGIGLLALGGAMFFSPLLVLTSGVGGGFGTWAVALAYGQLLFNKQLARWQRRILILSIVGWVYWAWVSAIGWVSGWLPLLTAIGLISFFKSRRLFLLLMFLFAALLIINGDYYRLAIVVRSQAEGDFRRPSMWADVLSIAATHPLLGLGPGNYIRYFEAWLPARAISSHNNYVDVFAQTGLLGTFFFAWFVLAIAQHIFRLRSQFQGDFCEAYVYGVLGGLTGALVGGMLGDWLLPFVYNIGFAGFRHAVYSWMFLGGIVALGHFVQRRGGYR